MVSQAGPGGISGHTLFGKTGESSAGPPEMDKPHVLVRPRRIWSRRDYWGKIGKAARDDFGRACRNLTTLDGFTRAARTMIGKTIGYIGVLAAAAFGATVGVWAQQPYPISILERNVLTPLVKPGEEVEIELVVDRRQRCDQIVSRFVQYANGYRDLDTRELPSTYGRMGRDIYIVKVPTNPNAPHGPAEVYSTGRAECNPWQKYIKPVESGDPWHDRFRFGNETVRKEGRYATQVRENNN